MQPSVNFIFGETKKVYIAVESCSKDLPVEVSSASFSLLHGDTTEATGECEIAQHTMNRVILVAKIKPLIKNSIYTLRFTYDITPETFIFDVRIVVS